MANNSKVDFIGFLRLSFFVALTLFSVCVLAVGEKNSRQGNALGRGVFEILVANNICNSISECNQRRFVYGENGDRIYLNVYAVSDRALISEIVEFIVRDGLRVTDGIPVTIRFYAEKKNMMSGLGGKSKVLILEMEVNK